MSRAVNGSARRRSFSPGALTLYTLAALALVRGPAARALEERRLVDGPVDAAPDPADVAGKEHNQFVFVRDSAIAQEKFALALKMERLKEWNKSADLYQEVLEKYRDRVIPYGKDRNDVITRYTSVTWGVLRQLARWPQEGLDVYRGRYEPRAAELLNRARGDDLTPLHEAFRKYFVTESGKQAGLRLIDANLERGEFAAAAEIGDQLLTMYPPAGLLVERPGVLFRTALAYHLSGDAAKAKQRAASLSADYARDMGVVRGRDVILAEAIKQEMSRTAVAAKTTGSDSWPTAFGGPSRGVISTAKASAGTRMYSIPLAKPNLTNVPPQVRPQVRQAIEASAQSGSILGILPAVDRGELFFHDGTRVYAVGLDGGQPLPGWAQTYPNNNGQYMLPGTLGTPRQNQQTLTVTERYVLAVMGQPDRQMMMFGVPPEGDTRLVCLNRITGREEWTASLANDKGISKNDDEKAIRALQMSGSPLVVGDNVLVIGRSSRTQQGEDCYVVSFELNSGKYRWGCYIASSGMPAGAMFGVPTTGGDSTSHLAYANGRVYVLTNLGAVAALDAYSGTIVWLNIYPLDLPQVDFRRGMNPGLIRDGSMGQSRLKPWQYNPVVLQDGKLFVLPAEGKNLLIYDAQSGTEVKRISLETLARWTVRSGEQPERPTTLVGVSGERLVLAGDSRVLCLNWIKYDDDTFPGSNEEMIFWPSKVPGRLMGRPFMTTDAVFVCADDRMRQIDMASGNAIEEYPRWPRSWEENEGPGNVLVTNDHVILAGAGAVDVFMDLAIATKKLDQEIAAGPTDPEPRLRYAELMYAAGQGDAALKRMDEAIGLLGGIAKMQGGLLRDRLFADALSFANKSLGEERPGTRERVVGFFDRAGAAAQNPQQQVHYRLSRAKFAEATRDAATAVRLYQEILGTPDTRAVSLLDEQAGSPTQADEVAERAIDILIKSAGPGVYEPYQDQAAKAMTAARAASDAETQATQLQAVAQAYPNSTVAPEAMLAAADAYESARQPRAAIRVLRQMWFKYQKSPTRVQILEAIARNYLAVPDRNYAEMTSTAAARLALGASMSGPPKLTKALKLPDGTLIADAGTTFSTALEEVRKISSKEAGKSLPDFRMPIPKPGQKPYPKPFRPAGEEQVLADATVLVLPAREFSRPDRVLTWSRTNLSIFPAGQTSPLATSKAFASPAAAVEADRILAAPRGVAWVGDIALVWGATRLVAIDGKSGRTLWEMDLSTLPALEVVRPPDSGSVATVTPNQDEILLGNNVVIRGRVQGQVRIVRNGVVQVVQPQQKVVAQPAVAEAQPGQPAPPQQGGGEQVAEVRPVGDRVLVTTTNGRLLSAELSSGRVAWQTRLAEKAADRLVASEDFTVVRVSDDLSVRLVALDTFSGRMLGGKTFNVQSTQVPVNLALSPDGTLVYTMPDRMCLRDLYKAWSEEEKVITGANAGQPAQMIYAQANQPGQLIIAEGRILALADSGGSQGNLGPNDKYVRVHSLETGQPLKLSYTSGGKSQEVERLLTAGTKDWNVMLRTVGPHLYVIGPKKVYGYNLDRPAETWNSTDPSELSGGPSDVNFRDAFIGVNHLVVLDQPSGTPVPTYRLSAFARYKSSTGRAESGKLDYNVPVADPAGVAPAWQACDGGFYYATADGKVRMLMGAM